MSSLSDSCSMLVFKYYENLVAAVKHDLTPQSVCHLSGQCSYKFHTHADYIFPEERLEDLKATESVLYLYIMHVRAASAPAMAHFVQIGFEIMSRAC